MDDDDARFLFTAAELAASPSIRDGLTEASEAETRHQAMKYMAGAGTTIYYELIPKTPHDRSFRVVISHAMLLFHRFFARASMCRHDAFVVATAALMLAGKATEYTRHSADFVVQYAERVQRQPLVADSQPFLLARDSILAAERELLNILEYFVDVPSPYPHIDAVATRIGCSDHAVEAAYRAVNDMMRTTLPLRYHMPALAQAALIVGAEQKARAEVASITAACTADPDIVASIKAHMREYWKAPPAATAAAAAAASAPAGS